MANAVFAEVVVGQKPKRTRKTHKKVRSGCLTCKIRRKKCDETKPFCNRCTSTGRKCDGYAPMPPPAQKQQQQQEDEPPPPKRAATGAGIASPDSGIDVTSITATKSTHSTRPGSPFEHLQTPSLWRPPQSAFFGDEVDYECFDFFRSRTGPEFAAYFDSSMWRSFILRACFLHPTVLQAATAVGAVHRRFELGITPEAFRYCEISLKQYRKAVRHLANDLESNHPNAPEIKMLVHLLFSIFETFQSNYDAALHHMNTGLRQLLKRRRRVVQRESRYKSVDVGYASLRKLVGRLEDCAPTLFGTRTNILSDRDIDTHPIPMPRAFKSLHEARDFLVTEARWIFDIWNLLPLGLCPPNFSLQHQHISRLLSWSMAYAEFSKTEPYPPPADAKEKAYYLKHFREALYLALLTQIAFHDSHDGSEVVPLCDPPETCDCHTSCRSYAERKAALNAHFARLLVLVDPILKPASEWNNYGRGAKSRGLSTEGHSLSVDSGIGPPLYLGSTRCRSTKVRHQVTSLLDQVQLEKEIWGKLGVYSIAEKLSSIEEHAVVQAGMLENALGLDPDYGRGVGADGFSPNGWIKRTSDTKWVDVTVFLDEGKLLIRYCREDQGGGVGVGWEGDRWGPDGQWAAGGKVGCRGLVWTQEWVEF